MTPTKRAQLLAAIFGSLFLMSSSLANIDADLPTLSTHAYYSVIDQDHLQEKSQESESTFYENDFRAIRKSL